MQNMGSLPGKYWGSSGKHTRESITEHQLLCCTGKRGFNGIYQTNSFLKDNFLIIPVNKQACFHPLPYYRFWKTEGNIPLKLWLYGMQSISPKCNQACKTYILPCLAKLQFFISNFFKKQRTAICKSCMDCKKVIRGPHFKCSTIFIPCSVQLSKCYKWKETACGKERDQEGDQMPLKESKRFLAARRQYDDENGQK